MPRSQLAAERGEPSYVWRAGQERRLQLIAQWSQFERLDKACVLVDGCGLGAYAAKIAERYGASVHAFDIEAERIALAQQQTPTALVAAAEYVPYASNRFDMLLSHEVIEHVQDDVQAVREMVRVLKPGGRVLMFCPNRWYPFETHGHYWRDTYHFGNTPLINYLPDVWRDKLAPHVRAYTARGLRRLFEGLPVTILHHSRVYGAYDNIIARLGKPAEVLRDALRRAEQTPLDTWGLSHFLVAEKH